MFVAAVISGRSCPSLEGERPALVYDTSELRRRPCVIMLVFLFCLIYLCSGRGSSLGSMTVLEGPRIT